MGRFLFSTYEEPERAIFETSIPGPWRRDGRGKGGGREGRGSFQLYLQIFSKFYNCYFSKGYGDAKNFWM